ncbi:MAG: GNAT family N-acetyltransferase [Promethearchaeota archaeon]
MVLIRKASLRDIQALSKRFLDYLADKNSRLYQENVVRFGIPEEYVRRALAEEPLMKAVTSGEATFYIALEENELVGFAQIIQQDVKTAEQDLIVVFPSHERKGIGTHLLKHVVENAKIKDIRMIIVNAGKNEDHARRFYEKNGFKLMKESTIDTPWGKKLSLATYQLQLSP